LSLVLDSSITLAFILPDERTAEAEHILNIVVDKGAWAPFLWRLEVANSLSMAVQRGRIRRAYRDLALGNLASLDIQVDSETDKMAWTATLGLADQFALTVYDAAYLELSIRRNLPLATLDTALQKAATQIGRQVLGATDG
jgi:predicted nucleic acid-binding protein